MSSIITDLLKTYKLNASSNVYYALKEVLQLSVLNSLAKIDFFKEAVFCGATSLKIFYNHERITQDLNFVLKTSNSSFSFFKYVKSLKTMLLSFGLDPSFSREEKELNKRRITVSFDVHKLIIKFNSTTFYNLFKKLEKIDIKIEINVEPIQHAVYKEKILQNPYFCIVDVYDLSTLYANKLISLISKPIRGRDLFDYLFFLAQGIEPNYKYLQNSLVEYKLWDSTKEFNKEELGKLLIKSFKKINIESVLNDEILLINELYGYITANWTKEYFYEIINNK